MFLSQHGKCKTEIRRHIGIAGNIFQKIRIVSRNDTVWMVNSLHTNKHLESSRKFALQKDAESTKDQIYDQCRNFRKNANKIAPKLKIRKTQF